MRSIFIFSIVFLIIFFFRFNKEIGDLLNNTKNLTLLRDEVNKIKEFFLNSQKIKSELDIKF